LVSHTKDVMTVMQDVQLTVEAAESSKRGYLLTGDELFRSKYARAKDQVFNNIGHLRQLTNDNLQQRANLDRLSSAVQIRVDKMEQVLALRRRGRLPDTEAVRIMREGSRLMADIGQICVAITAEESRLLTERIQVQRRTEGEVAVCFAVGILVSVLLLYWAYELIRRYGDERDHAETKLRALNADLEVQVRARTVELTAANERLTRSNEDLTQFACVASHDLQEPIRTMGSYAGLLARRYEGRLDEKADEYTGYIVAGAHRMQALVQDLLSYSRVGAHALKIESIDTETLLEQVKQNLRLSIIESQARITNDPLPRLNADSTKLTQVFQNLIGNAMKFAKPEQNPMIHISAEYCGSEWVFSVRDNGIGFEPRHAERIFGIFQRLHPVGAYGGTGIGLAISKRIVVAHGGRVWAQSKLGIGSTFFFTIPAEINALNAADNNRLVHALKASTSK
jgi:signal transduction histidine kinase